MQLQRRHFLWPKQHEPQNFPHLQIFRSFPATFVNRINQFLAGVAEQLPEEALDEYLNHRREAEHQIEDEGHGVGRDGADEGCEADGERTEEEICDESKVENFLNFLNSQVKIDLFFDKF